MGRRAASGIRGVVHPDAAGRGRRSADRVAGAPADLRLHGAAYWRRQAPSCAGFTTPPVSLMHATRPPPWPSSLRPSYAPTVLLAETERIRRCADRTRIGAARPGRGRAGPGRRRLRSGRPPVLPGRLPPARPGGRDGRLSPAPSAGLPRPTRSVAWRLRNVRVAIAGGRSAHRRRRRPRRVALVAAVARRPAAAAAARLAALRRPRLARSHHGRGRHRPLPRQAGPHDRTLGPRTCDGPEPRRLAVYLKRHSSAPWWRPAAGDAVAGRRLVARLQGVGASGMGAGRGVPVPRTVAAAEYVGPAGRLRSFLAVEELHDMLPLNEAVPLAAVAGSPRRLPPLETRPDRRDRPPHAPAPRPPPLPQRPLSLPLLHPPRKTRPTPTRRGAAGSS